MSVQLLFPALPRQGLVCSYHTARQGLTKPGLNHVTAEAGLEGHRTEPLCSQRPSLCAQEQKSAHEHLWSGVPWGLHHDCLGPESRLNTSSGSKAQHVAFK